MFRPVRMSLANVLLLKEDLPDAVRALTEAGCLEVERPKVLGERRSLKRVDTDGAIAELVSLRARIEAVAATLQVLPDRKERFSIDELRVDPRGIRALIERKSLEVEQQARRISLQIEKDRAALSKVDLTAWAVSALEQRKVDTVVVSGPVYIGIRIGTLPTEGFVNTRRSMGLAGHQLYSLGTLGVRTFACAVTTAERVSEMNRGLKNARFEALAIRSDLVKEGRFDSQAVELQMWETRERLTENGLALIRLARESEKDIRRWLAEIDLNMRILEAMNNFLEGDYSCLVTGWVPTRNIEFLERQLGKRCENPVEVMTVKEEEIAVEAGGALRPPTKLANPRFLRPFELIIDMYGTPAYNSINPTPFVALTFLFIFGAMFGDVGHGMILGLLGGAALYFAERKSALKDLGGVLVGCGVSSMVFGFVYGEVFGHEDVVEVIWLHPMQHPEDFLFYGVVLGAVVINLGMLINILQTVLARHFKEAFFGEWGLSTLFFYWGAISLFTMQRMGHGEHISWGVVAALLLPPLAASAFGGLIVDKLKGREADTDVASAVFKPVELLLASLTNTISFVRVPAFALTHAALMGAVFLMAEVFEGGGAGSLFASKVDIVVGNIVVIALEGLIVFVQAMRLQYYEFFGKFFHHQGRKFAPLAFEDGRRTV